MDWETALPLLEKGSNLIADELALLTLFSANLSTGLPRAKEVTCPALDTHDRKVILRGHLWQLGERKVKMAAHEQNIDMEDSVVLAFTVWRDECTTEQWEFATKSLVKFTFSHFADVNMHEAAIQADW